MNYSNLTQEQKDEYNAKRRKEHAEKVSVLTPEQLAERKRQRHEWWISKTPEERKTLNKVWQANRWQRMTPEQKLADKERLRQRRENFTVEQLEQERKRGRDNVRRLKMEVLNYYSNGTMCCMNPRCEVPGGATNVLSLCVDHITGGGFKHSQQLREEGTRLYQWLKRNKFPPGYQVLCQNCNIIKKVENKEDYTPRKNKRIIKK